MTPDEEALHQAMSDVSETCYAASWMQETDVMVWQLLHGTSGRWGQYAALEIAEELAAVRAAARKVDVWIVWDRGDDEPRPIPLAEWRARVAAQGARR